VEMIDYISIAVLKPLKLYRLYTLISFVHEAEENQEIMKNSGKTARDVHLRYSSTASVVVPDTRTLPVTSAADETPGDVGMEMLFPRKSFSGMNDNKNADADTVGRSNRSTQSSQEEIGYDDVDTEDKKDWNVNENALLESPTSPTGNKPRRSTGQFSRKSFRREDEGLEMPLLPPPPPGIPPLCEGIPLELYLLNQHMEAEKERLRQEEEERYALLHPKILTSKEQLEQMLETTPAAEIVDMVSSAVASSLKQVGETLEDGLKRQEAVWTEKVEKIDQELQDAHTDRDTQSKKKATKAAKAAKARARNKANSK